MDARPTASAARFAVGQLQTVLYRQRGLRWIAAAGAAAAAFVALGSGGSEAAPGSAAAPDNPQVETTRRLPPATRGIPVPGGSPALAAGAVVDVHEVRSGAAVVHEALVVEAGEDEMIVAVPVERVGAMVDALTTGGVILVLVPEAP